jgi:hypothetical protein
MSSSFPGSIASLRRVDNRNGVEYDPDKKSVSFAEDHNYSADEIEAIETELGTNPAGAFGDVADRLDDVDARVAGRVSTTASSATPTPPADDCDIFTITALAAAAELQTPSGTPRNGQKLIIRIKDNGVARALTYSASYRAIGVTLPATTTASKELYLGAIYNSASTKWEIVALAQEE